MGGLFPGVAGGLPSVGLLLGEVVQCELDLELLTADLDRVVAAPDTAKEEGVQFLVGGDVVRDRLRQLRLLDDERLLVDDLLTERLARTDLAGRVRIVLPGASERRLDVDRAERPSRRGRATPETGRQGGVST